MEGRGECRRRRRRRGRGRRRRGEEDGRRGPRGRSGRRTGRRGRRRRRTQRIPILDQLHRPSQPQQRATLVPLQWPVLAEAAGLPHGAERLHPQLEREVAHGSVVVDGQGSHARAGCHDEGDVLRGQCRAEAGLVPQRDGRRRNVPQLTLERPQRCEAERAHSATWTARSTQPDAACKTTAALTVLRTGCGGRGGAGEEALWRTAEQACGRGKSRFSRSNASIHP